MEDYILNYAKLCADTIIKKYTPQELPPSGRFHYHQGVFLVGLSRLARLTGDRQYKEYIKSWVDMHIDKDGHISNCSLKEFDDIQPGMLLFDLYKETGGEQYKKVLDHFYKKIEQWPTNAEGGVWHKYSNKNQMWLDSMYMMGVISAMYADYFNKPYMFNKIHKQMMLMYEHMTDKETGLMYHMWDDSKECPVVDKQDGLVKVFWGRAMGWYAAAIVDIIEHLPYEYKLRQDFIDRARDIINAVYKFQDSRTGLWYQVVNMPHDNKNWLETSCSSLFVYAAAKAVRLGIIDKDMTEKITEGCKGVLRNTVTNTSEISIAGICVGTGVGRLEDYFNRPTKVNDLHGVGAFLLMCTEVYNL